MVASIEKQHSKVPEPLQGVFNEIVQYIQEVCRVSLNEEYEMLAIKMTAKLARKRPSPLLGGRPKTWACGVLTALGTVNFLYDKSQKPHMKASELAEAFGLSASTGGEKGKQVRNILKIATMDPDWTLPSKMDDNFTAWMILFHGLLVDVRHLSREIQEVAYAKGLIPYIPKTSDE